MSDQPPTRVIYMTLGYLGECTMDTLIAAPNGEAYRVPSHHYSEDPTEALFFWGGPFSNFVGGPWTITARHPWFGGVDRTLSYETVEHFFAACKAKTAQDHDIIRNMRGPWDAKRAGRRTDLREDWEAVKYDVMLTALRVKFGVALPADYGSEYRDALLATGDRLIAEDSPHDYVWGIRDRARGYTGANLLGWALMEIRNELRGVFLP